MKLSGGILKSVGQLTALILLMTACNEHGVRLVRSNYAEGEVKKLCDTSLTRAKAKLDLLAKASQGKSTIQALLAMETIIADLQDETLPLQFMSYVSTSEKLRDEGADCESKSNQFLVEVSTRKDLYDAVKGAKARNADEARLLEETIKSFESNGLGLPSDTLAKVRELKQKLAGFESAFSAALNNDTTSVNFTAAELEGTSDSFRERLVHNADGSYVVTTKSTDYNQVMENAVRSETRRKMLLAYYSRGGQSNVKLMEDAIAARQEIAHLSGFATWADYRTQNNMAQNAKNVNDFLAQLRGKLTQKNHDDLQKLLAFKKANYDRNATTIDQWDINFLAYQLKKRDFDLDDDLIREYFPAATVMKGMFEVYSTLLSVNFVEVKDPKVWSPEVKLYEIRDKNSGKFLAYFYADYFPRAGKYGHAASFSLILGRKEGKSGYTVPVSAIVANFNPPANGKPSLLAHDEVETIFHEFGHIMHQTLTRAPYVSLSGTNVAHDFVEAPSQMLENWVWDEAILSKLSGHYLDSSRKLPAELLKKLLAAKDFNQGYAYTRQLYFGLMDMEFHSTNGPVDTTAIVNRLHKELFGIDSIPGGLFHASFGHLMGGYDAGYYGYLWSEVYAQDMFTRFEKDGLENATTGAEYRRMILEPGNMRPALDLVEEFLGRKSNPDAFYRKLGIK